MSEYDSLIEGFDLAKEDPGPLTDEEHQAMQETLVVIPVLDLDPIPPSPPQELRVLRSDQIPQVGVHYVVFDGKPMAVVRGNYAISEDEHVRAQLAEVGDLKDHDGQRLVRADRTLRLRYRGYLCGEVSGL